MTLCSTRCHYGCPWWYFYEGEILHYYFPSNLGFGLNYAVTRIQKDGTWAKYPIMKDMVNT